MFPKHQIDVKTIRLDRDMTENQENIEKIKQEAKLILVDWILTKPFNDSSLIQTFGCELTDYGVEISLEGINFNPTPNVFSFNDEPLIALKEEFGINFYWSKHLYPTVSKIQTANIYSDGGIYPNPGGHGGYGTLVKIDDRPHLEFSQGFQKTTNNRMELMGALVGLEHLRMKSKVKITSDSQYVVKGINYWMDNWKKRNWIKSTGEPVANSDLWQRVYDECLCHYQVKAKWIKGHSGHIQNERCDYLATKAKEGDLIVDYGYEKN